MSEVLINETKASYEYDREQVLEVWAEVVKRIPERDNRGYTEGPWLDDDGRIICLFELLCGSQFGDMIFGSIGNDDQGSNLVRDPEAVS